MIAFLMSALFVAAALTAIAVLARDTASLFRRYGEWSAEVGRIDRDMLCDPAAFALRPVGELMRGVPARRRARPLRAAA